MNRHEAKKLMEKSAVSINKTLNIGYLLKDAIERKDDEAIQVLNQMLKDREEKRLRKES